MPERAGGHGSVCRARPLLGTLVQIQAAGLPESQLQGAVDAAFAAVLQVHALMSFHDPASELSCINRGAARACQSLHPHTRTVLAAALRFAALSAGAFDPCVADVLAAWGCLPAHDPAASGDEAPAGTGTAGSGARPRALEPPGDVRPCWRDVELTAAGVRFARPLAIDLGGIAKGYAVDLAVAVLLERGVRQLAVNAGGDLRVAGEEPWEVQLRHPLEPAAIAHRMCLHNAALATSAACFSRRPLPGGEVSALVEPRTRQPWLGTGSVSVRAGDCMSADALTKIVLFAPPEAVSRLLAVCAAEAVVLEVAAGDAAGNPAVADTAVTGAAAAAAAG